MQSIVLRVDCVYYKPLLTEPRDSFNTQAENHCYRSFLVENVKYVVSVTIYVPYTMHVYFYITVTTRVS